MDRRAEAPRAQTASGRLSFALRAAGLRSLRAIDDWRDRPPLGRVAPSEGAREVAGRSVAALFREVDPAERTLELGKVHNVRIAARALHGRRFEAGEVFSFWRHVGPPTARRGFVLGREVREGCLVPSIGGGLCLLSNALYDAALDAGLTIVERHAHSVVVPGSLAETSRDATVFYSYVDLRLTADHPFAIDARLSSDALEVAILAPPAPPLRRRTPVRSEPRPIATGSCVSCGNEACPTWSPGLARPAGRAAFLLDAWTPEVDAWVQRTRRPEDVLLLPMDGRRVDRDRYAWSTAGFARVSQAWWPTLGRALASRRLAAQGAARQRALLAHDAALAEWMAARLGAHDTHLVVHQHLLPHLARAGALGGRTYDVVMRRAPLARMMARLDEAARRHPESPTLADFRPPRALVDAEAEALAGARRVITAHSEVAADLSAELGARAVLLDWRVRRGPPARRGDAVVFLGPVVGREGVHVLRDAMRGLEARGVDAPLVVAGRDLEGGFAWGRPVGAAAADPLDGAALVVAPAWVRNDPRALLLAAARGVSVVASHACGLRTVRGVTSVPTGDADALAAAIADALSRKTASPPAADQISSA